MRYGSTMIAFCLHDILTEFHGEEHAEENVVLGAFIVSVYVGGLLAGPLVWVPVSKVCGRLRFMIATGIAHVLANGASSFLHYTHMAWTLAPFRIIAGVSGVWVLANGWATVEDLLGENKRKPGYSLDIPVHAVAGLRSWTLLGRLFADAFRWHWVFRIQAILVGLLTLAMVPFGQETQAPTALQQKIDRLRKETDNQSLQLQLHTDLIICQALKGSPRNAWIIVCQSKKGLGYALVAGITYRCQYALLTSFGSSCWPCTKRG
ncbi:hypothetical protein N657DRAFT_680486 [Parathielavia appendiculata]|uniref:Major facilitator superfamily (MFS) profile domain-containing protein n=1 Tax=Parathielavia appendiculata TaxID=2587402 RepID=A0AAN6U1L8_9PEZI|nr:hypothetical protein N657DRAFT_680486 [Parathielavia appendiculata]